MAASRRCGLFDCASYIAAVSGSAWALAAFFTYGNRDFEQVQKHFKARLKTHFAAPQDAFELLSERPTSLYLLRGVLQKLGSETSEVGIVDLFGTLLSSRILVPQNEFSVRPEFLKMSNQRAALADGELPLPIYTSVRHEIPKSEKSPSKLQNQRKAKAHNWFEWFETTPYYFGCEEIGAWIPTWAFGRAI